MNLQLHNALFYKALRSASCLNGNSKFRCSHSQHHRIQVEQDVDPNARDWKVLQLAENSGQDKVRRAYLDLAKEYHPDSGGKNADAEKFQAIDTAYKNLQKKFAEERHNQHKIEGEYGLYYKEKSKSKKTEEKDEVPDIQHTAPQHRQYLNYDGVGSGTPAQREKLYQKYRASKAVDNILEHRINKVAKESGIEETAVAKDSRESKKIKTRLGMDRLVEDMIQESMARGDFKNLKGQGQPLKQDDKYNPYVDFTTHKLNQVLIDNGFTPEWILLEKEIREDIVLIREKLSFERHKYAEVLDPGEELRWHKFMTTIIKPECDTLNVKINKYNLVVPTMFKQIIGLQLERESRRALQNFSKELFEKRQKEDSTPQKTGHSNSSANSGNETLLDIMFAMFKNK